MILIRYPQLILKIYRDVFILAVLEIPVMNRVYAIYKKRKKEDSVVHKDLSQTKSQSYSIQGCSYFLTPNFFEYYTQLFPKTFLYWEEINLLWYLYKVGLKANIVKTAPVLHKVSQSTNVLVGNYKPTRKKLQFVLKGMVASTPLYFMSYKKIKREFN